MSPAHNMANRFTIQLRITSIKIVVIINIAIQVFVVDTMILHNIMHMCKCMNILFLRFAQATLCFLLDEIL